jgi:prevent-host-death family protein
MPKYMTSRDFNQDTSRAKRVAESEPVYITDRGRPAHVLISAEQFEKLSTGGRNIVELLAMPQAGKVRFDPPRVKHLARPADFDD